MFSHSRIGLEAGPLAQWLFNVLAEASLPVICVGTRHMRAVLQARNFGLKVAAPHTRLTARIRKPLLLPNFRQIEKMGIYCSETYFS